MLFEELVKKERVGMIVSLHEGFALLLEEVDELKKQVWKKSEKRNRKRIVRETVQIAAVCQRMLEDLGYVDIPTG